LRGGVQNLLHSADIRQDVPRGFFTVEGIERRKRQHSHERYHEDAGNRRPYKAD
jgi:hypothetical protein